jgi:hypothetical protein
MWHQFLPNLSYRSVVIIGLLSISVVARSQDGIGYSKGIIESLDELTVILETKIKKEIKTLNSSTAILKENRPKQIYLEESFVASLLYFSKRRFVSLFDYDECSFYSALENDLLTISNNKEPFNILMAFEQEGNLQKTAIDKDKFFLNFYKGKCFNNFEISSLFQPENLTETVKSITFPLPKEKNQCLAIHENWLRNPYTPYLCGIMDKVELLKKLKEKRVDVGDARVSTLRYLGQKIALYQQYKNSFTKFQLNYLNKMCENILDTDDFCSGYLDGSTWSKVINNEKPSYLMSYKCADLLNKKKLKSKDLKKCKDMFTSNPYDCAIPSANQKSSIFPRPSCTEVEDALSRSSLITNYHDCPGKIRHQAIINLYRILNHFEPNTEIFDTDLCASDPVEVFQQMTFDGGNEQAWNYQVCFEDKIKNKQECSRTLFAWHPKSKISHEKVIASILPRFRSTLTEDITCKYVTKQDYNPVLLEYQTGCNIVYDPTFCNSLFCPQDIFFDKKKIDDIKFFSESSIAYFPSSYSKAQYSLISILEKKFIKSQAIKNATELKVYLKLDPNNIIHGTGCGEDLLPEYFNSQSINQCSPIHFIIDGFSEKDLKTYVIIRTAYDDIHSPRTIKWNYLFSSIKSYQNIHPINIWPLYGIKK